MTVDMDFTISERVISDTQPAHDTPESALAAAWHSVFCRGSVHGTHNQHDRERAVELLAAMPDWTLVPSDVAEFVTTPQYIAELKAEIARLREIEAAAQAHIDWEYRRRGAPRFTLTDLRAVLDPSEP